MAATGALHCAQDPSSMLMPQVGPMPAALLRALLAASACEPCARAAAAAGALPAAVAALAAAPLRDPAAHAALSLIWNLLAVVPACEGGTTGRPAPDSAPATHSSAAHAALGPESTNAEADKSAHTHAERKGLFGGEAGAVGLPDTAPEEGGAPGDADVGCLAGPSGRGEAPPQKLQQARLPSWRARARTTYLTLLLHCQALPQPPAPTLALARTLAVISTLSHTLACTLAWRPAWRGWCGRRCCAAGAPRMPRCATRR